MYLSSVFYLDPLKPLIPVIIGEPEIPGFLNVRQAIPLNDSKDMSGGQAFDRVEPPGKAAAAGIGCPTKWHGYFVTVEPLFHAIVLKVAAGGFTPRCARESEGEAVPRITRVESGLLSGWLRRSWELSPPFAICS